MAKEAYISHFLPDGSFVSIPFSKWERMTDEDFYNINSGATGRFYKLPGHLLDNDEFDIGEELDDLNMDDMEIEIDDLRDEFYNEEDYE